MKQPELGIKISDTRNQRSITQKELSEYCNIDIRTIQRIESGEVIPRASTLKLIASALSSDISVFNGNDNDSKSYLPHKLLLILLVTGIINLISWILFSPILPKSNFLFSINLFAGLIHTITGVFFYFGFYNLGNLQKNSILKISSIIIMVCIPLFFITVLISTKYSFAEHLSKLTILISGINSILFGIGLLYNKSQLRNWYKFTGVLQIVIAPFFIIPLPILNLVGCWLSIPFILLLLYIVYLEFKESKKQYLSIDVV